MDHWLLGPRAIMIDVRAGRDACAVVFQPARPNLGPPDTGDTLDTRLDWAWRHRRQRQGDEGSSKGGHGESLTGFSDFILRRMSHGLMQVPAGRSSQKLSSRLNGAEGLRMSDRALLLSLL